MASKITTLALVGLVGSIIRNRDNSHEESTIHLTGPDGTTGVLALRVPVQRDEAGVELPADQQGLTAGKYSISLSLTEAALQPDRPADGNGPLLSEADLRATGVSSSGARASSRRASDIGT